MTSRVSEHAHVIIQKKNDTSSHIPFPESIETQTALGGFCSFIASNLHHEVPTVVLSDSVLVSSGVPSSVFKANSEIVAVAVAECFGR